MPIERILIVDDNDGQTLFWDMLLPELKLQVFKSRTGLEALEIVEREHIQIAVVSWELNSMPGTIFVQKARSARRRRRMPFLMYSKRMSAQDIKFAKELGIDNLLSLPLDKAAARSMMQTTLDRENNIPPLEAKLRKMEDCNAEGRPTDALKVITPDLTKKGPHLPRYKTAFGETLLLLGQFDRAEKAIKEALALDPEYLPAKYILARCNTAAGKHDDAIAILDAVSSGSPKNIQSIVNLGSAFVSADRLSDAKQMVSRVKTLDPDSTEINDVAGKVALKEGNIPLAAQMFAETENGDDIARFYNSLGISLVAKGNYEKGIETYNSAIKILTSKTKMHLLFYNLALAFRKKQDPASSLTYLCESYIAEPGFERAYAAIARAVEEHKKSNATLPMPQLKMVKDARKRYLDANPKVAEKIKARLDAQNKPKIAS